MLMRSKNEVNPTSITEQDRVLARAMARVLPHYMMPDPRFDETKTTFKWTDNLNLKTVDGRNYNEAMTEHYLKERKSNRELYERLAHLIREEISNVVL